jgi:glycosyltransferase involved in cell wall biosynthesis
MHWTILTGEYPPQTGGVSDYNWQLARGLSGSSGLVSVFVFESSTRTELNGNNKDPAVVRLGNTPIDLWRLGRLLEKEPKKLRLLVQYVPHAFGWKAMNLPFALWLWLNRRRWSIWTMFHEVAYPIERHQPLRHRVIALVTRFMAGLIARASARIYVSIPAWEVTLRELAPIDVPVACLPVPSSLPTEPEPTEVIAIRAGLSQNNERVVVGHFSTFGTLISSLLEQLFPALLTNHQQVVLLMMGRGNKEFAELFHQKHSSILDRLVSCGDLSAQDLTNHLAACDLIVQPYPDGVSGRRTTIMAGLALGIPVVTNEGHLTESFWRESNAVAMADTFDVAMLVRLVGELIDDSARRRELGKGGRAIYSQRFHIDRTIEKLRADAIADYD